MILTTVYKLSKLYRLATVELVQQRIEPKSYTCLGIVAELCFLMLGGAPVIDLCGCVSVAGRGRPVGLVKNSGQKLHANTQVALAA